MNRYSSPAFEKLLGGTGFARRPQQDALVSILAAPRPTPVFVQGGTGVGKSFALLSRAADVGKPGLPAVVATATNNLLEQYAGKDLPRLADATGVTFVRVLGRSNYACADSMGAQADGVIADDPTSRRAWLEAHSTAPFAMAGELAAEGLHRSYGCPGYPACQGNAEAGTTTMGGCASKRARARAFESDIVLTNFHYLYYNHFLGGILLPQWSELLIDEAHHLPEVVRDLRTTILGPGTGATIFLERPKLLRLTEGVIKLATEVRAPWGRWDTERPVNFAKSAKEAAILAAYKEELAEFLTTAQTQTEAGEEVRGIGTAQSLSALAEIMATREELGYTAMFTQENPEQVRLIPVTAHESFLAEMVGNAALVTGTAGPTLPSRCGRRDVALKDVGHPFDYATQTRGWVSQHTGVKASNEAGSATLAARLAEVIVFTEGHPSLILCTSHADVRVVAGALFHEHRRVFMQPTEGGSLAANEVAEKYKAAVCAGDPAVLIGTSSYATGLDLPGKLLTRLVMWSFFGVTDYVLTKMRRRYRDYVEEQRHTRVVQGLGRLIRTTDDTGEILVADSRFWDLLRRVKLRRDVLDRHLLDIPWEKYPTR